VLPESLAPLGELAANLRWVWHRETCELFESVDPDTWARVGGDPGRLLGEVSRARLEALAKDRSFLRRLRDAGDDLQDYLEGDRWYQQAAPGPRTIAYFSPEFGLTAVLPQYSGGLGILAGDHLKAASDLGVPIIGVGLLYRHGYFRQVLSRDGWQQERYPIVDPDGLPLTVLREQDGTAARVQLALPGGRVLQAQIWLATVGRVPLLLLDTDVEENAPVEREVTDRLYGGGGEHRLLQELLLGIGGVRALRAYCRITGAPKPDVYHTNEGHAGFQGIERIRELGESDGVPFDAALEAVRAGTVFTTHTPVPAGIDRFSRDLVWSHFDGDDSVCPGVPVDKVASLGTETYEGGDPAMFNMAVMGLRLAQRANGVSKLHGVVSRDMFGRLWPGFDETEVPIASVTNGVHAPTWVADEMMGLLEREVGTAELLSGEGWDAVEDISDDAFWKVRRTLRERLVDDARRRLRESSIQRGSTEAELGWVDKVLDPDVLTIGFARRVPSYKRLTLMLRDRDRLKALLLHPQRPVQLVIAGKAHPADEGGKQLIQEIVKFADDPEIRHRIIFLPGYEIDMAQVLVPGCDVWLNNPLRPYEACGTSGMKSALNGGLNLSIRDGWWDEWYDGRNGWAIPSAEGTEDNVRDDLEARALYELIETQVAPRFYARTDDRPPAGWLDMVRHTVKTLGPKVLATRMVRDYVEGLYAPAARSFATLDNDFTGARQLADWKHMVIEQWPGVRVDHVESPGVDATEVGSRLSVRAFVTLAGLEPTDVDVQVVSGRVDDEDVLWDPTTTSLVAGETSDDGSYRYEGEVSLDRTGPFGYTVRIVPRHEYLASIAELGLAASPPPVAAPA